MSRSSTISTDRDHTGNRQIDSIQRRLNEVVHYLQSSPFAGAQLLTEEAGSVSGSGLEFASGVTRSIPHKLGRKAKGFLEVYGSDVPTTVRVGLFASAHPIGTTSATHITVTPTWTGKCWVMVF